MALEMLPIISTRPDGIFRRAGRSGRHAESGAGSRLEREERSGRTDNNPGRESGDLSLCLFVGATADSRKRLVRHKNLRKLPGANASKETLIRELLQLYQVCLCYIYKHKPGF